MLLEFTAAIGPPNYFECHTLPRGSNNKEKGKKLFDMTEKNKEEKKEIMFGMIFSREIKGKMWNNFTKLPLN